MLLSQLLLNDCFLIRYFLAFKNLEIFKFQAIQNLIKFKQINIIASINLNLENYKVFIIVKYYFSIIYNNIV